MHNNWFRFEDRFIRAETGYVNGKTYFHGTNNFVKHINLFETTPEQYKKEKALVEIFQT